MATRGFTPASGQDVFRIEPTERPTSSTGSATTGREARSFYENLIGEEPARDGSSNVLRPEGEGGPQRSQRSKEPRTRVRRVREVRRVHRGGASEARRDGAGQGSGSERAGNNTNHTERTVELQGLRLLRCANNGDIPGLKELLSRGADINFQDSFFWTAVMCASWSGQRAAVRLLLQHGAAWVGVVDTQGRDAKDLALEAGHADVLEELENYGRSTEGETESSGSNAVQPQWCNVCRSEYSSSLSSHLSSTLHQFSLRRAPPTPYYCLPPSSISYKMMVRSGWTPGRGLGPEGEGRRQPVSTVLKRDQVGLGFGRTKAAKVTHFQARDRDAVRPPSQKKEESGGKKQREEERRKEQRDKNWERDFRASFYL